jgi:hypothetical protein
MSHEADQTLRGTERLRMPRTIEGREACPP